MRVFVRRDAFISVAAGCGRAPPRASSDVRRSETSDPLTNALLSWSVPSTFAVPYPNASSRLCASSRTPYGVFRDVVAPRAGKCHGVPKFGKRVCPMRFLVSATRPDVPGSKRRSRRALWRAGRGRAACARSAHRLRRGGHAVPRRGLDSKMANANDVSEGTPCARGGSRDVSEISRGSPRSDRTHERLPPPSFLLPSRAASPTRTAL